MGSDNIFHKRKAKSKRDLSRKKNTRAPYERVLIVCEGQKTEPKYFSDIKYHLRLNSANIEITGDCGSSPASVVAHAKDLYRKSIAAGDAFDKVYCVFDKDSHDSYEQAKEALMQAKPISVFKAIYSVPSFEYWLLLHFELTTRPYENLPGNSSGRQVLSDLKKYMPDYSKGSSGVYQSLLGQLRFAKENSRRTLEAACKNHTDMPSTLVHELVEFMESLKAKADAQDAVDSTN